MATPLIVAETVLVSAVVELSVPVATPLPFVELPGCVSVLPEPVAARTTVAPLTAFPFASLAVTVIVDVPLPAVIEVGDAVTVDCAADTAPAVTVTVAVCVIATPLMVAETAFDPATVELRLPVATPLALVGPAGCVSVLPEPLADSTTVAPLIGFPPASRAVTVIVDVPLPAVTEVGDPVTVDCDAETGPTVTVTLAVWLSVTPPAVAEMVFVPTTVDRSVPVATPLELVALAGCVSVLPEPVALSATVTPLTGLPFASRAVTVIVDVPLPAAIDVGDAVTVDCVAETGPAVTVKLAVATPLPLVGAGWVNVLPEPVADSTTVAPLIGFPLASRAVTVIVDVPLPAVIDVGEATTLDCDAETDPVVTVTVAVCATATPLIVADTVLVSGVVELSEPVAIPLAFVALAGCVSELPEPLAASTTVAPLTRLPFASRAVTVIVEVPLPAVIDVGDAVTVDCDADTGPAVTVMLAVCVRVTPPAVAVTVLLPAVVELSVPVATPLPLVGLAG